MKKYDGFRLFYNGLNKFLDYKGRASRIEYASIYLLTMSLAIILNILFSLLDNPSKFLLDAINGLFILATLSVTARRLHDLGYSGWLQMPMVIIQKYIGSDINVSLIILILVLLAFNLFLMFKEGQNTANKYGEKPNTLATI